MESDKAKSVNQKLIAIVLILLGAILILLNMLLMSKLEWGFIIIGTICIIIGLFGGIDTSPRKHS